ncbi:MAG: biotin--[Salinivirgaceae bacterium]|nr:biotin--[acetyl-CoA-carboxylase] ligase [Salinivirgaceae bacterium]
MIDFKIDKVSETLSTNELLKSLADREPLPEGYTVVAVAQTAGRGQIGASWESQPGQNLTFSVLLRPDFLKADQMFLISKVVALALTDYLESTGGIFKIKWPNDIYHFDSKICGTLIENQFMGDKIVYSIVGIGLNVNQEAFISDAPNPVSMFNIFDKKFDLTAELPKLLHQIAVWYQMLADGWEDKINESYFSRLYRTDKPYDFIAVESGERFTGQIAYVESNGHLTITDSKGLPRRFWFKEVAFADRFNAGQPINEIEGES